MLKVKIICVGNLKEKYLKEAFLEYKKRLMAFCIFEVLEISEHKLSNNPSRAEIEKAMCEEGKKILSKISKGSYIIALCIEGKEMSSEKVASYLDELQIKGVSDVNFIIGGSFGLSDEVKAISNLKLSMSPMTFPHQLARVMLCEQIYRAFQISSGGKYHK